jgi:hypothetical protein
MGFENFTSPRPPPCVGPKTSSEISSPHTSPGCGEKANFRTFITSLAALWMNLDDVVARAADGQTPAELVRAQALRQIATVSLAVQAVVWVQAVLEIVVVAKAEHVVARRRVMVLLGAVDMIALVS